MLNSLKTYVGDTVIDINRKGLSAVGSIWNCTNHVANTNYVDALPLEDNDRRWMVLVSKFSGIKSILTTKGLSSEREFIAIMKKIGHACDAVPGEFRKWFLEMNISNFDPDGRAPMTEGKLMMTNSSKDEYGDLIEEILEEGGWGLSSGAFLSTAMHSRLKIESMRRGMETVGNRGIGKIYAQLGFGCFKKVKIKDQVTNLWVKDHENLEDLLDSWRR